jgi:hypothetical protein
MLLIVVGDLPMDKEITVIESAFCAIEQNLREGSFTKHELDFVKQMCLVIISVTDKTLLNGPVE